MRVRTRPGVFVTKKTSDVSFVGDSRESKYNPIFKAMKGLSLGETLVLEPIAGEAADTFRDRLYQAVTYEVKNGRINPGRGRRFRFRRVEGDQVGISLEKDDSSRD